LRRDRLPPHESSFATGVTPARFRFESRRAGFRVKLRIVEPGLARWLAEQRIAIEREAARAAGALDPASPEAEAMRRFRSFVLLSLARGEASPSLEGLRVSLRRAARAIDAWLEAARTLAGPDGEAVRVPLAALRAQFVAALGASAPARLAAGAATPSARRAIPSAVDRIADVFLAADTDSGAIVDANPAACALLGLARPELLTRTLADLCAPVSRPACHALLDALAESPEPQRTALALLDASATPIPHDLRVTRITARGRPLAILIARPNN
jgi:PAS domain S-box-containing protein